MRFAYADPPYLGVASKFYGEGNGRTGAREAHPDAADFDDPEVHRALLQKLYAEYPDGLALSASQPSLARLLPMIPKAWKVRIGIWCKTYVQIFRSVSPCYAWEPVLFRGGRKRNGGPTPRDWVATPGPTVNGKTFTGAKPDEFCYWLFDMLNMRDGDELDDLFPGSGRVARAWDNYRRGGVNVFTFEAEASR